MIIPDKKRAGLNKFFTWIHDFFNFKSLWLEKILKFLYIFETLSCIGIGFFMLFSGETYYGFYGGGTHFRSYAGYGLLLIILGPIITRIIFEFIMLAILQVKNTIDINNKLVPQEGSVADIKAKEEAKKAEEEARAQYQQPVQPQYVQPQYPQEQYPQAQYPQAQYPQSAQQNYYEQPGSDPNQPQ